MFAIKSKRTNRYFSEYHNDWMNSPHDKGCRFATIEEAAEVAEFYCDHVNYELVSL